MNLRTVQNSYALDYTSSTNALENVEKISSHFQQIRINVFGFALSSDSKEQTEYYIERIAVHKNAIDEGINAYHNILDAYDESEVALELTLLNNVQTLLNEFGAMRKQLMDKLQDGSISMEEFTSFYSKGGAAHDLGSNVVCMLI